MSGKQETVIRLFRYQQFLIVLLFVSAILIFLDLGIFSASFIFGVFLLLFTVRKSPVLLRPNGILWLLFAFLIIALLSMVLSVTELSSTHLKLYIQTIYWFLLAVTVCNAYPELNKEKLSKYAMLSVLLLLVLFVTGFRYGMTQNGVSFVVIIMAPLGYYFLKNIWLKLGFAGLLIYLVLLNGSRTGAILVILQAILMVFLALPGLSRYFKYSLVLIITAGFIFNQNNVRIAAGRLVKPYNERLGELLINYDYVLRNDKSWLVRKAQVQKGKQIFEQYPVLGIGYTNFAKYTVKIDQAEIESDRRLNKKSISNRSSHNTYISLLAETGILGFSVFVLFLALNFISFWKYGNNLYGTFEGYVFISLIGMSIYFYIVSGLLGTSAWIVYGLFAGATSYIKNMNSQFSIQ